MSNAGDVTCMATIPVDMEVEAHFLAKEDGIVAGIALSDMVFELVDPSIKVSICKAPSDEMMCVSLILPLVHCGLCLILGGMVSKRWRVCTQGTEIW